MFHSNWTTSFCRIYRRSGFGMVHDCAEWCDFINYGYQERPKIRSPFRKKFRKNSKKISKNIRKKILQILTSRKYWWFQKANRDLVSKFAQLSHQLRRPDLDFEYNYYSCWRNYSFYWVTNNYFHCIFTASIPASINFQIRILK